jgi:hypothetical protein
MYFEIDPGNCTNQNGVFKKPYKTLSFDRLALENVIENV